MVGQCYPGYKASVSLLGDSEWKTTPSKSSPPFGLEQHLQNTIRPLSEAMPQSLKDASRHWQLVRMLVILLGSNNRLLDLHRHRGFLIPFTLHTIEFQQYGLRL